MSARFGLQGDIIDFLFKDLQETFYNQNGVLIEIKNSTLMIGVDEKIKLNEAKQLAELYLLVWSERQNTKLKVNFNHRWKTNPQGGRDHSKETSDTVKLTERLQMEVITHQITLPMQYSIVTKDKADTASFSNDHKMVQKALHYPVLKSVLQYYSQEIVDDERPLYGMYKALEAIIGYLASNENKGRKKLAALANESFSYVDDVMQTTQSKRHHQTKAMSKLDDEECKQRAKILIDAFAETLP